MKTWWNWAHVTTWPHDKELMKQTDKPGNCLEQHQIAGAITEQHYERVPLLRLYKNSTLQSFISHSWEDRESSCWWSSGLTVQTLPHWQHIMKHQLTVSYITRAWELINLNLLIMNSLLCSEVNENNMTCGLRVKRFTDIMLKISAFTLTRPVLECCSY